MAVKIQLRGDTKANWLLTNPILSEREIVLETDTGKYKIGDGVAHYADLSYHGIDGKPSRITADGFWEIYNPATDTYDKTEYKAIGIDGKSAFELWQALEGNADKTLVDFFIYLKGEKGDAFTFDDFTIEQLALLKGASAYQVWKAQDGNEDKTVDEYLQYIKGAPFTYADFTPEQIIALTGKSAYQIWLDQPGNEGKTVEEYLIAIKGQDGQSAYLDAVAKGYAGTKDEFDTLLAGIGEGGKDSIPTIPFHLIYALANDPSSIPSEALKALFSTGEYSFDKIRNAIKQGKMVGVDYSSQPSEDGEIDSDYGVACANCEYSTSVDGEAISINLLVLPSLFIVTIFRTSSDMYAAIGNVSYAISNATSSLNGLMSAEDKQRLDKAIVPADIVTLTSLSTLSNTKYSQKYTYTTTTAQGINIASAPAEGFECMLDIKNGTSSQITQAIPNSAAWQCEETSLVIPAGKVGSISIRYVHGKYCVRVGL